MAAFALGALAATGLSILDTVLAIQGSSIAGIFPDVVIEEVHTDESGIPQHPVEYGTPVGDHIYDLPPTLSMKVGWSDSSVDLIGTVISGGISGGFSGALDGLESLFTGSRAQDAYDQLLALKATHQPFDIVTKRRMYTSMAIRSLRVTRDKETNEALVAEVEFQQILIVKTSTTTLPPLTAQAIPQDTASPVDTGTAQPVQKPTTILKSIGNGVSAALGG